MALRSSSGDAGRVLKIRDEVAEHRYSAAQFFFEYIQINAIVTFGNTNDLYSSAPQQSDGAVISGRFYKNATAGFEQCANKEFENLKRTVCHKYLSRCNAVPFGKPLTHRSEPWRASILQQYIAILAYSGLKTLRHVFYRKNHKWWRTARKIDHCSCHK